MNKKTTFVVYLLLALFSVFVITPLLLTVFTAFKDPSVPLNNPWKIPFPPVLKNLGFAWAEGHFGMYLKNSVFISTVDALIMVFLSVTTGYAFAFFRFKASSVLLNYFLLGIIVPPTAIIIPLFVTVRSLGLYNNHFGVVLADIALALPIFIFLMRGFFVTIPKAMRESGRLDGAGELIILMKIILPMAKPAVVTVALLEFIWSWNDLLLRLVFLSRDAYRTMTVGLLFFQGTMTRNVHGITAGTLIMIVIPMVLFAFFRRQFIEGMASGAVKG